MKRELWAALRRGAFSMLLFAAIFWAWPLRLRAVLWLWDGILLLVGVLYGRSASRFFGRLLTTAAGGMLGYALARLLQGRPLRMVTREEYFLCFGGFLLWSLLLLRSCASEPPAAAAPGLFPEQVYDKQRVIRYLQDLPLVGIHARWGNGKSHLWAAIRSEPCIQREFEVVQIDLLACNLDQIESVLIRELEKLLEGNRIYPENSHLLKSQLGKAGVLEQLGALADETGFADAFDALTRELDRLPKKVLLNFEDIDRIKDEETVKKIFAISEKISSARLHVVFQYNRDSLPGALRERDYLEKYVPYNVELTPIAFATLVEYFWAPLGMETLPLEKAALTLLGVTRPSLESVKSALGIQLDLNLHLEERTSIRKVKAYLKEVRELLTENPELAQKENAAVAAMVLLLKHFYREGYEVLRTGVSPLEQFRFREGNREYTLFRLVEQYKNPRWDPMEGDRSAYEAQEQKRLQALKTIFAEENQEMRNGEALLYLCLLGYEVPNNITGQITQARNDKIDHLVWYVLACGSPELTDAENEIQQLNEKVFARPKKQWKDSWKAYQEDRYYGRFPKKNTTVMKMGDHDLTCSFRAMQTAGRYAQAQTQLLELLEMVYPSKTITDTLVEYLVCCDWNHGRDLYRMAAFFRSLQVEGNPAGLEAYRRFFSRSMAAIAWQGYDKRQDGARFEYTDADGFREYALEQAKWLKQDLQAERAEQSIPRLQQELDVLIDFVAKNEELLRAPNPIPQHKGGWKFGEPRSEFIHQKEIDRLIAFRQENSAEAFEKELAASWDAGNLYYLEAKRILNPQKAETTQPSS